MGNLFSISYQSKTWLKEHIRRKNDIFNEKGVFVHLLKSKNGTALIYIYRKNQLEERLGEREIQNFLGEFGYDEFQLEAAFEKLENHLNLEDFPHEIGVFLDYPLEDIRGFIHHRGKNFTHSGCWKVYHNPENALLLFQRYKKCVRIYLERYAQGFDMNRLVVAG